MKCIVMSFALTSEGHKVIGTENVVSSERNMSRGDAKVAGVIGGGAFDAAQDFAGFGAVTLRVLDPALEAGMLRAFKRLFSLHIGAIELLRLTKARLVVESAAGINAASPRRIRGNHGAAQEAGMRVFFARLAFERGGEVGAADAVD